MTTGVAIATKWATLVDEEAIPLLGLADDEAEAKLADVEERINAPADV